MISVVIPAYNAAEYLAETIQSVQAQTFTDWELVLVDDGSKDGSLAIADEFCRQDSRICVFSQKNAGVSTARNLGLAKSSGVHPHALCLDSDDLLVSDALQRLLLLLESNPDASAACGFVQDVDAEGHLIAGYHRFEPLTQRRGIDGFRLIRRQPDAPLVFGDLCFHNHITSAGQVLMRKTALRTAGGFDVTLSYLADYEMWWRLAMRAGPIAVTPEPVLLYRHHGNSMSADRTGVRRDDAHWRWELLTHPAMSPQQKRVARAGYFYHCLVYLDFALFYLRAGKIKQGLKQAGLGVRDMLYYVRDLRRARRKTAASGH